MNYLVFGDSHSMYFNINESMRQLNSNLRGVNSYVKALNGSTISGFGKRNSTLKSHDVLLDFASQIKLDYLCFALGQVDIELGYYYRVFVKKESLNIAGFIDGLIDNYFDQIDTFIDVLKLSPERVIIKGINPSVLTLDRGLAIRYTKGIITENVEDQDDINDCLNEMKSKFPSNIERNKNHFMFNEKLKEMSAIKGYKYFDIVDEVYNYNSSSLSSEFIPSTFDHHLTDSIFVRMIHVNKLLDAAFTI
ncbi:hypothetical protein [Marinobacterium aestuariivivens]|uniref:SGNH hydrolase-type esterase domain-containing protein n=1 Tax=Marinobacterium aestuariivivens TaxID=1698799 RepID=A0ABW1ZVJ8_9GAMM